MAARRSRPGPGGGHRPGLRHPRPDRVRGSLRLRRHRQRHEPGRSAVLRRRRLAGAGHRPSAGGRRGSRRVRGDRRGPAQGLQPDDPCPRRHRPPVPRGEHMTTNVTAQTTAQTTAQSPGPMSDRTPGQVLSDLDEPARYRVFDDLQGQMPGVWDAWRHDLEDESVVVVPSISLEHTTADSGTLVQAMEERALFQVLLLRQPRLRMVFVTSMPVSDSILEYYLGLLPGVIPSHARSRLTMLSVGDATPAPLSAKLLARPRLLRQIRACVPNASCSHL